MGEWPNLSPCLPFMNIHVSVECQMDARSSSKAQCCWQAWPIWSPEARSLSLYVLCKPFPRPFLPVRSVSYCLVAAELNWNFSLDRWSFQDSEVLEGVFYVLCWPTETGRRTTRGKITEKGWRRQLKSRVETAWEHCWMTGSERKRLQNETSKEKRHDTVRKRWCLLLFLALSKVSVS